MNDHGPLWVFSCFCFESFNRRVKQLCHGLRADTKTQIARRVYTEFFIKLRIEELGGPARISPEVRSYISNIDLLRAYLTDEQDAAWEEGT